MFSKTEALKREEAQIDQLMNDISSVSAGDDEGRRQAALKNMIKLYQINKRWNLPGINEFLVRKQKELKGW